jgi:hypothetical protein
VITGAHSIIYSSDPDADRSFFRDVLEIPHVDVGDGWLNFDLAPSKLAVHPADRNDIHEIYLMCDDIQEVRKKLSGQNIPCSKVEELSWGSLIRFTLPGGGSLGIYQPRHASPAPAT